MVNRLCAGGEVSEGGPNDKATNIGFDTLATFRVNGKEVRG